MPCTPFELGGPVPIPTWASKGSYRSLRSMKCTRWVFLGEFFKCSQPPWAMPHPLRIVILELKGPQMLSGPRFPCIPVGSFPACSVLLHGSFATLLCQVLHICLFLPLGIVSISWFGLLSSYFSFSYLSLWAIRVISNQMRVEGGVSHTSYGNSSIRFLAGVNGVTFLCSDSELQTLAHAVFSPNSFRQSWLSQADGTRTRFSCMHFRFLSSRQ